MAVAHAVIAREVRGGFRRRHNIIDRQRVFRVRQADVDQLRARGLQPLRTLLPERVDLGRRAVDAIFFRDADAQPLYAVFQRRFVIGHGHVDAGGILRIHARHVPQHDRRIAHRARDGTRLIERRCEGDDAPARATSVSRLDADRARDGGRLTDRAARIGRRGAETQKSGDGRGRTARRSARHQRLVRILRAPGIDHRLEIARLVRRPHGELVHVDLAEHDRARVPQVLRDGRFIRRNEVRQDAAAGRGAHALGAEQILDGERQAFERTGFAFRETRVGALRHGERAFGRLRDERVERARILDGLDESLGQLLRRDALRLHGIARIAKGKSGGIGGERHGYSTTLGTTKK